MPMPRRLVVAAVNGSNVLRGKGGGRLESGRELGVRWAQRYGVPTRVVTSRYLPVRMSAIFLVTERRAESQSGHTRRVDAHDKAALSLREFAPSWRARGASKVRGVATDQAGRISRCGCH